MIQRQRKDEIQKETGWYKDREKRDTERDKMIQRQRKDDIQEETL